MDLNEIMEFDHVIQIMDDGSIIERGDLYAPDVMDDAVSPGWSLLDGWSGQYGYCGPTMHASEFIGGRLADHILETPGIYVVTTSHTSDPEFADDDITGWVIARKDDDHG